MRRSLPLTPLTLLTTFLLAPAALSAQPARPYADRVEIRRTTYGVPHIMAEDLGAFGYAMAWVQLEDYGARVAHGLVRARGHLAR